MYYTITQTVAIYKKSMAEWEKQYRYDRDIVRSAPERQISVVSVDLPATIEETPG